MLHQTLHPSIYEINTLPWLAALSDAAGHAVDLAGVPQQTWDELAEYDAVWLMGAWQRSPAGVAIAMTNTALTDGFESALPGYEPADVAGSPYCIRDYVVDVALGGRTALALARAGARSPWGRPDPRLRPQPRGAGPSVGVRTS